MSRSLPLFPLGTVLYPGLLLPLHIFEERYRIMVADLVAQGGDVAEFGVVAMRHGHESQPVDVRALYEVGCVARVRRISEVSGGRYDIVTTGTQRFRLLGVGEPAPYLWAEVEPMDDPSGEVSAAITGQVREAFLGYLELVSTGSIDAVRDEVPTEPRPLSYLVAATMALALPDRQRLLEAPDAAARLRAELELLTRETQIIRALGALPATDLTRVGFSLN